MFLTVALAVITASELWAAWKALRKPPFHGKSHRHRGDCDPRHTLCRLRHALAYLGQFWLVVRPCRSLLATHRRGSLAGRAAF